MLTGRLTAKETEDDLVPEHSDGSVWAIEIRRERSATARKRFHIAGKDLQPDYVLVVYAGRCCYPVSDNLETIGLRELAGELKAL